MSDTTCDLSDFELPATKETREMRPHPSRLAEAKRAEAKADMEIKAAKEEEFTPTQAVKEYDKIRPYLPSEVVQATDKLLGREIVPGTASPTVDSILAEEDRREGASAEMVEIRKLRTEVELLSSLVRQLVQRVGVSTQQGGKK
jgi:hypothetical protein